MQRFGAVPHCLPSVPDGHLSNNRYHNLRYHGPEDGRYSHAEVIQKEVDAGGVVQTRFVLAHANVCLTVNAGPSVRAGTLEAGDLVSTRRAVEARIGRAVVHVDLAERAGVALVTLADEGVVEIRAAFRADRVAGVAETLVNFRLAMRAAVSGSALADEPFELIDARGAVLARIGRAIVDGVLALLAGVTGLAGARVIVDLVDALAVVSARLGRALVDVALAGRAEPSRVADALVLEQVVDADAVQAGAAGTKVDLFVAALAGETGRTVAGKVVDQVGASGVEQAGSLGAVVDVDLATLPFPPWRALARVASLLEGEAGRAVVAGILAARARIDLRRKRKWR